MANVETYFDEKLGCEVKVYPSTGVKSNTPKFNNAYGTPDSKYNKRRQLTTGQFVARCKKHHGDRYDYSKTVYLTSNELVTVICREHGEFRVTARAHQTGGHCPKCK